MEYDDYLTNLMEVIMYAYKKSVSECPRVAQSHLNKRTETPDPYVL